MSCADSAKEVCAIVPGHIVCLCESQIHLMDQRGALQREVSALAPHVAPGLRM